MPNRKQVSIDDFENDIKDEIRHHIMANDGRNEEGITLDVIIRRLARLEYFSGRFLLKDWRGF